MHTARRKRKEEEQMEPTLKEKTPQTPSYLPIMGEEKEEKKGVKKMKKKRRRMKEHNRKEHKQQNKENKENEKEITKYICTRMENQDNQKQPNRTKLGPVDMSKQLKPGTVQNVTRNNPNRMQEVQKVMQMDTQEQEPNRRLKMKKSPILRTSKPR